MKNKGYTLVELIIVIAIMAILAGMSFVTIGIIRTARCTAAVDTFNNQISSCLIRTKAIANPSDALSSTMTVPNKPYSMLVTKRGNGRYAILLGYRDIAGLVDASNTALNAENDDDCVAILPKEITKIVYTPATGAPTLTLTGDDMVIQFVKSNGSVAYGAGKYEFYSKKTGTESVCGTITLDKDSGNH